VNDPSVVLGSLIASLVASCTLLLGQARQDKATPNPGQGIQLVRAGMTPTEVRDLVGPPARVARQILYGRYLEQWAYDKPYRAWIEFNCVKGQKPFVLAVHAGAAKPVP
jgi:hypothetical protein